MRLLPKMSSIGVLPSVLVFLNAGELTTAQENQPSPSTQLNDVHSRLNATTVNRVLQPQTTREVIDAVRLARREKLNISISGARHSMGGQQFAQGALHLDMRSMNRFLELDPVKRLARVEPGITWPELLTALEQAQSGRPEFLTIRQKQTGADELTLGGAVSTNIHGRGLAWRPFVADIESVTIVDGNGEVRHLSRESQPDWFRLVVGGYGLFGVITEIEMRLVPRMRLERVVEITTMDGLADRVAKRVRDGFVLGDFQFCPDETSDGFMREGVFACYRPVAANAGGVEPTVKLNPEMWRKLIIDAHADKRSAWTTYTAHYKKTHGQHYWHDLAQFNHYDPDYVEQIEAALPALEPGSLMISELYVPRARLQDFMAAGAQEARRQKMNLIYGTVRFIEQDEESFLPWARQGYACIVVNLRVTHSPEGEQAAQNAFRTLIDLALERDGSFFLTYHRWATREQMLRAYPQFPDFLEAKKRFDPGAVFQSEWHRHWQTVFEAEP